MPQTNGKVDGACNQMSKHEKMPATEVLDWLFENHPDLHLTAELDRSWVWIVADLRGDNNRAIRESIKEFGFRFAKNGHALPSGKLSHWGHSCDRPTRFKRRGGKGGSKQNDGSKTDNNETVSRTDAYETEAIDLSAFADVL